MIARVSAVAVDPREMSTWTLVDRPTRPIAVDQLISVQLREDGQIKPSIFNLAAVRAVRTNERHWREFVIQDTSGRGGKAYLQVPWEWCVRSALERLRHWVRASTLLDTIAPLSPATLRKEFPGPTRRVRIITVEHSGSNAGIEMVERNSGGWH